MTEEKQTISQVINDLIKIACNDKKKQRQVYLDVVKQFESERNMKVYLLFRDAFVKHLFLKHYIVPFIPDAFKNHYAIEIYLSSGYFMFGNSK